MERNLQPPAQIHWGSLVEEAKNRRKEQKVSQETLGLLVGLSKPTINKFEKGDTTISVENALKILKAVGLVTPQAAFLNSQNVQGD